VVFSYLIIFRFRLLFSNIRGFCWLLIFLDYFFLSKLSKSAPSRFRRVTFATFILSFSEESARLLFVLITSSFVNDGEGLFPNSLCNCFWVLFIFYPRISDNFWSLCIVPFWSLQKLYQFRAFIQSFTEVSDWLLIDLNNFLNLAFWLIALYCFSVSYFALLLIIHFKTSLTSQVTCYFAWVFRIGFLFCLTASFLPIQPFPGQTA